LRGVRAHRVLTLARVMDWAGAPAIDALRRNDRARKQKARRGFSPGLLRRCTATSCALSCGLSSSLSSWLRASPTSSRLSSQRASSVLASCHLHRLGCSKFMQSFENAQVPHVDSYCARCVSLNMILRAENRAGRRRIEDAKTGRWKCKARGERRIRAGMCATVVGCESRIASGRDALEWKRGP